MILTFAVGCISALNAYAVIVTAHAPAGGQMTDVQLKQVRELVRSVAEQRGLAQHEFYQRPPPAGFSIRDHYGAGQRTFAILINDARDYLEIYVTDWESAGEPSSWQRAIENDLRTGLVRTLPDWTIETRYEDLGFWGP